MNFEIENVEATSMRQAERIFTVHFEETVELLGWDTERTYFWPTRIKLVYVAYDNGPWVADEILVSGPTQGKGGRRLMKHTMRDWGNYRNEWGSMERNLIDDHAPQWLIELVKKYWPTA